MLFEIESEQHTWLVVYDKAERHDGSLFFPERLTKGFLAEQRRTQGPYIYANQYQNEILPDEDQDFKKEWLLYYEKLPPSYNTFIFIDPAISQQEHADYTAYVVVHVDPHGYWYVEAAKRQRITATETVKLIFDLHAAFKPRAIGIETVAYQQALLHFLNEEMKRRATVIPVTGIKRGPDKTKEQRILSLVPRYEWGRILHNKGLEDLEDEYAKFPRSKNDDIMDALASIEEIVYTPSKERNINEPRSPNDPGYESAYIRSLTDDSPGEFDY